MSLILERRAFLQGLGAVIAAPAIIRADRLMKLPRREIISPVQIIAVPPGLESPWPQVGSIAFGADPAMPIFKANGERIAAGDLRPGAWCSMIYDGARWRLLS
ncbi:hypothetical protein ACRQ5Q_14460 [Bradyrhizobium sp. PMVTL-01]|uniref:hypothetical protein n=1 Tax=Bradyrhizobium sp. PMVTL-01 TaxID=3434999 RepID=UPI003F6F9D1B